MLFSDFKFQDVLCKAVTERFPTPTAIQSAAIPAILDGQDLLGSAHTGSGKTLAFGLPLLSLALRHINDHAATAQQRAARQPCALILVPTRELASQVENALLPIANAISIELLTLCGGLDKAAQVEQLSHDVDILIATPGRLRDLLSEHAIATSQLRVVCLDEADRLLDMGFWPDIDAILGHLPPQRQTLMFSATSPEALNAKIQAMLNQPAIATAHTANSVVESVEERLYLVNKGSKAKALIAQLNEGKWQQALVFIGARDNADAMCKKLNKAGITSAALHGDKDQQQREQTLQQFKAGDINVLVATDLLARGIHIDHLPVVFNVELPSNPAVYVHRVGRTARAGETGLAISLVCHGEMEALQAIRTLTQRELPLQTLAAFPVTDKPSTGESKRAPRDKKANRRTQNKKSIKQFQRKPQR